jgi:hypothetical protein
MNDLTVLAPQNDPFRVDTPARHRDGEWLAITAQDLGLGDRTIHLRGLHYMVIGRPKPDGTPYTNTDEDWNWLTDDAGKAARWLGYLPFDQIVDQRNSPPMVRVFTEPEPAPYISVAVEFEVPELEDLVPRAGVADFRGVQPYRLVFVGEKSSLADVLGPIAARYHADLYLPTGEISDTLLHTMASTGAGDGRPMVVFCFSDADPAGWQMPVSIGRKLQAFKALSFDWLDFRVYRVALTPHQVREYGLPSTPLKDTETRADRWRDVMGVEQTEIDALASLRPALLRAIVEDAVAPFFDHGLDRRVEQAEIDWLHEAQAVIDAADDADQLERIRVEAVVALAGMGEEIAAIADALRVDADDFDLPNVVIPEAEAPEPPDGLLATHRLSVGVRGPVPGAHRLQGVPRMTNNDAGRPLAHLADHHRALLTASAISEDVAGERHYFTVNTKADLARMGFGRAQQLAPGLVIPLWNVAGEPAGYQLRPDEPRANGTGKPIRYETPARQPNVVDVPPRVRPMLGDPTVPLIVTEGCRKADAGAARGLCVVSISGVYGWRGTNGQGGKVALADWEQIALNGRKVLLAFDSDAMEKVEVHEALARLRSFLLSRKAEVRIGYLPTAPNGAKVGLDDWLAEDSTRGFADLAALAREHLEPVVEREPVDDFGDVPDEPGWAVLDDVAGFFDRFLALPAPAYLDVLALWALHTHAIEVLSETPRLAVLSAEKQSGKTRVLELMELVAREAWATINMSAAFMFRSIEDKTPTLLVDESDAIFGPTTKGDHEDLRAIINAGHRRGSAAGRMVGEGAAMKPVLFNVFCPVALAGIGDLPETVIDRSVVLHMRRRLGDEHVEPFEYFDVEPEGRNLGRRLAAWAQRHHDQLEGHRPTMPAGVVDRPADVWRPLVRVADVAGGEWPERARAACLSLRGAGNEMGSSAGVRLLRDIAAVFTKQGVDRITSTALVERLIAVEESPWGEWGRQRKPITPRWLAERLRPYDIKPAVHRQGDLTFRGYLRDDFTDAWDRYLPPVAPTDPLGDVTAETSVTVLARPVTGVALVTDGGGQVSDDTRDAIPGLEHDRFVV